uniref:Uncharacterized protein n=1 Tax=Phlebotomus papatasi TaxID=29031 RepID=A0A1B0GMI6_PHLPP
MEIRILAVAYQQIVVAIALQVTKEIAKENAYLNLTVHVLIPMPNTDQENLAKMNVGRQKIVNQKSVTKVVIARMAM